MAENKTKKGEKTKKTAPPKGESQLRVFNMFDLGRQLAEIQQFGQPTEYNGSQVYYLNSEPFSDMTSVYFLKNVKIIKGAKSAFKSVSMLFDQVPGLQALTQGLVNAFSKVSEEGSLGKSYDKHAAIANALHQATTFFPTDFNDEVVVTDTINHQSGTGLKEFRSMLTGKGRIADVLLRLGRLSAFRPDGERYYKVRPKFDVVKVKLYGEIENDAALVAKKAADFDMDDYDDPDSGTGEEFTAAIQKLKTPEVLEALNRLKGNKKKGKKVRKAANTDTEDEIDEARARMKRKAKKTRPTVTLSSSDSDSDDEPEPPKKKKKSRIAARPDESSDEEEPPKKKKTPKTAEPKKKVKALEPPESDESEEEEEEVYAPPKKLKMPAEVAALFDTEAGVSKKKGKKAPYPSSEEDEDEEE